MQLYCSRSSLILNTYSGVVAVCYIVLQCVAVCCSVLLSLQPRIRIQDAYCNTHSNLLQHNVQTLQWGRIWVHHCRRTALATASYLNTYSGIVAVCCPVLLQCVAVCCSVLQCVAACGSVWQYVAVRCIVLQCCSVFQCVAVWCSVLHCVAVYYSRSSLGFEYIFATRNIPKTNTLTHTHKSLGLFVLANMFSNMRLERQQFGDSDE